MKKSGPFRFKHFSVSHARSSIKIGVDGVLTGALAPIRMQGTGKYAESVLDVGCGCGVIALMLAQRTPGAQVDAIDIDAGSVEEARENFAGSPWRDRLSAAVTDFNEVQKKYDAVVSNPPFFRSGVTEPDSTRLAARHQGSLSPFTLLKRANEILNPGGMMTFIAPAEFEQEIVSTCECERLAIIAQTLIRGHAGAPVKRMVFSVTPRKDLPGAGVCGDSAVPEEYCRTASELVLERSPGQPTDEYRALCHDFYLRF